MLPSTNSKREGADMTDEDFATPDGFIAHPLLGARTISVGAGSSVVLGLHYATTPEELKTGKGPSVHVHLTPQEALQLSEALSKAAQHKLSASPGQKMIH